MLLFSTTLEINETMTKDTFIKLVIEWNQGSPYEYNVIPNIHWNGEYNIRFGNDILWMEIQEYFSQNIIAVRYEKQDLDGVIWDTDYVMNFQTMEMTIRLDRSYMEDALNIDYKFCAPYFIGLLIRRGYLKDDQNLPVLSEPIILTDRNIDMLIDGINGKIKYRLPIVYVSKTRYGEFPVDVETLAYQLKGVAHVFVQEGEYQNKNLPKLYNGRIGVYFPNQNVQNNKYLYKRLKGEDKALLKRVVQSVIQYSNSQMIDTLSTWQGVSNASLREKLEKQRKQRIKAEQAAEEAKEETTILLEDFDDDILKLQEQIEKLTQANENLRYENQGLRAKINKSYSEMIPLLYFGDEYEFYQGEIKDLILTTLNDAVTKLPQKTRRRDIVVDILRKNKFENLSKIRSEDVKKLLKDYNKMTGKIRNSLENIGFEISDEGKHYKVVYYGDERYQIVFGKTPSDGQHSGKNNASVLCKKCF